MLQSVTIREFFAKEQIIKVPAYQRAYAWTQKEIKQFLNDLQQHPENKPYFFGTLLLEATLNKTNTWPVIHVVDGQQRLTTLSLFFHAVVQYLDRQTLPPAYAHRRKLLSRKYLRDEDVGVSKFETIDSDLAYFHSTIVKVSGDAANTETLSQQRLFTAFTMFGDCLESSSVDAAFALCDKIEGAYVIPFTVGSSAEATQIFELQNDRGVSLTKLESLKAYLMHRVYLAAKSPDQQIKVIQEHFAKIFRTYERIESSPFWHNNEDDILRWYAIAYTQWPLSSDIPPHTYLKTWIEKPGTQEAAGIAIEQALDIAAGLEAAFAQVNAVLAKIDCAAFRALTELFAMNRQAPFWPLLMKLEKYASKADEDFDLITRALEKFCMRAYAMASMKSGAGENDLFNWARSFKGDFSTLQQNISNKSTNWSNVSERFEQALEDPLFYYSQGADARYFFWRYENFLRSQKGRRYPPLSLRDYFSTSTTERFSIEHIASQTSDVDHWSLATSPSYLGRGSTQFREKYLHSLGNLVLDCHSPNAAKGNDPFPAKAAVYGNAPLVSQNELISFASKSGKQLIWDKTAIDKRAEDLVKFAIKTWAPD